MFHSFGIPQSFHPCHIAMLYREAQARLWYGISYLAFHQNPKVVALNLFGGFENLMKAMDPLPAHAL